MLYALAHNIWNVAKWIAGVITVFVITYAANLAVLQWKDIPSTSFVSFVNLLFLPGLNRTLSLSILLTFLVITLLSGTIVAVERHTKTITSKPNSQNRKRLLAKVRAFWISNVLEQSLYGAVLITLGLHEQPDAIANPLRLVLQQSDQPSYLLPHGTTIKEVYNRSGEELLILGEPGSGKTTLLLELARDLLNCAQQDDTQPIPVVFNLSSWALSRRLIADWLVEELHSKYQVPSSVARSWIETDQILPLLDGLDEVAPAFRPQCIKAINAYRREHGLVPLVVCSRRDEYMSQKMLLQLRNAVIVQPLTMQQVEDYFSRVGEQLESIRVALSKDPLLQELVTTPLMLNVLTLAYHGKPIEDLLGSTSPEERRRQIFTAYINRMLQRRRGKTNYTLQKTKHWISWLAEKMVEHNQTEYHIEEMGADWLSDNRLRRFLIGIVGGLISVLLFSFAFGPIFGLVFGLVFPLLCIYLINKGRFGKLIFGLIFGLVSTLYLWIVFGWLFGLIFGLFFVPSSVISNTISAQLNILERNEIWLMKVGFGVAFGIAFVFEFGTLFGMILGLFLVLADLWPQGRLVALRTSLFFIPLFGLFFGLLFGFLGGLQEGLIGGLLSGLIAGGDAFIIYAVLRVLLYSAGYTPWNYSRFLDFSVDRILLRKVGKGYIFIHRLLLEYFAFLGIETTSLVDSKDAISYHHRGLVYTNLKEYRQAIESYNRADALEPNNVQVIALRGETYRLMGRYQEALADFDRAIALGTKDSFAIIGRGLTYRSMGRYQEALEFLQAAIQSWRADKSRKSDIAWALSSCADVLECLGRTEEALAAYAAALQLLPDTAPIFRNRAQKLIHARHLEDAEADLACAVAIDGNEKSPYLWYRKAELAIARGDGLLADRMLDEAVNRNITEDILFERALSAWLCGDISTALEILQKALEQADVGDQAIMRREMELLFVEHPELRGRDELGNILMKFAM